MVVVVILLLVRNIHNCYSMTTVTVRLVVFTLNK